MREEVSRVPMRGAAFKMALALDGVPSYAGLSRRPLPGTGFNLPDTCCRIDGTH